MALANYSDLCTAMANWSKRTDLSSVYGDIVAMAESRIAKDLRLRNQVTSTDLTTVAGTQTVALPTDFLEAENLNLSSTNPVANLSVVTPEYMDYQYPEAFYSGQPTVYCVIGTNLLLGPTPDAEYTISLAYYAKFAGLQANSTNWLMTNYPSVYLSACMAELSAYTFDDQRVSLWNERYRAESSQLQDTDDAAVRSGSAMRVRHI